jgi:hypothetical protein
MTSVADCLRQHAPAYLAKFGDAVPLGHRKVLSAITRCRTGQLGGLLYRCDGCGREHWVGRSCGNRHCPTCGRDKTSRWLEKQAGRLLPVHHFLVTFTVPDQVRSVLRQHQQDGYRALFDAASQTLLTLAASSRYLTGCQLGFFGVLHTWGRDPCVYHPHVHFVVPGGGVHQEESTWRQTPENFLFPHAAVVTVYQAKLADCLRACGLYDAVPAAAWQARFVVDIKPVGDGRAVLQYLAPYVHRVAISDRRIVACDDQSVTFRYMPSGTKRSKTRTVPGTEFVRGFVQHTLPRGFQKIRYYGWMSPHNRIGLDHVKWLVWLFLGWTFRLASRHWPPEAPAQRGEVRCPRCGAAMRLVGVFYQPLATFPVPFPEHSRAYLDSG